MNLNADDLEAVLMFVILFAIFYSVNVYWLYW